MLTPPRERVDDPARERLPATERLDRLLHELKEAGTAVQRGTGRLPLPALRSPAPGMAPSEGTGERHPTGFGEIDALLGGGFPRSRLSEVAGPPSCGRTSLAHALLAHTTREGELACLIDRANAFDPISAQESGVDLDRVLWARPPGVTEALRCAEHVLRAEGFALVLLDLAPATERLSVSSSVWPRLRKVVASASAACVVLTHERLVGSFADLALELAEARPAFDHPPWLTGLEGRVLLVRNRLGPDQCSVTVRWASGNDPSPDLPSPPSRSTNGRPTNERAA